MSKNNDYSSPSDSSRVGGVDILSGSYPDETSANLVPATIFNEKIYAEVGPLVIEEDVFV